eukprot:scaffold442_cov397-Prasinococcus_capsulatus_cf.AAC.23
MRADAAVGKGQAPLRRQARLQVSCGWRDCHPKYAPRVGPRASGYLPPTPLPQRGAAAGPMLQARQRWPGSQSPCDESAAVR